MTRSRHRTFLETAAVFVLAGAVPVAAAATPPDPFSQLFALAAAVPLAVAVAGVLVYVAGYRRVRLTVRALAVLWCATVAVAFPVGMAVGTGTTVAARAAKTGGLLIGLAVGVWLAYHDGTARLRSRTTG